jgi:AraC-like DNA-binding protein
VGFRCWKPGPPLSEFVDLLWSVDGPVRSQRGERVLPTGTMQFVFAVTADGRPVATAVGPRSEYVVLDTSSSVTAVGVHFKPGGCSPFLTVPAGELHNLRVPLIDVWGPCATDLIEQMFDTGTAEPRFQQLESALLASASGRLDRNLGVRHAVRRFEIGRPVHEVVREVGISERRFLALFRDEVGLSPKVFSRVRRFTDVLRSLDKERIPISPRSRWPADISIRRISITISTRSPG